MTDAFEQWSNIKPDRIVFTGDLVHSKNQVTPELIEITRWVLSECSKIAKTVVIIGNHDFLENNMDRLDTITPILETMEDDNISYYKDKGVYVDENINWVVYSLTSHNEPPEFTNDGDNKHIGLFHGPVQGLSTDIGYEFTSGYDPHNFKGCDLVLCGDIHKRQIFDIPGGKAYMVGSTIQQNFGESVSKHGYGVYTVSEDNYEFFDLENQSPFLQFKITDIEDIEYGREVLLND
jgi:DNA repair exonuclease SbcCD nuclease subunit